MGFSPSQTKNNAETLMDSKIILGKTPSQGKGRIMPCGRLEGLIQGYIWEVQFDIEILLIYWSPNDAMVSENTKWINYRLYLL